LHSQQARGSSKIMGGVFIDSEDD